MDRGVGGEDGGGVRGDAVAALLVLVPHQGVPVHQEHEAGGSEGSQVLAGQVVGYLNCNKKEGEFSVKDGIFSVASQNFIQGLPANLLLSLITQAFFVRLLPPSSFL